MPLLSSGPSRLTSGPPGAAYRRLRRAVLARRRLLAALAAAAATAIALQAAASPAPPTTPVLTAAHDLLAGSVITAADLRTAAYLPGSVPDGALDAAHVLGRTTVGPVRAGEPITDARLLDRSLLTGYPGLVAVPVRIGDPGTVALLRVGDRVDVLAADPQGRSPAELVAENAHVVVIPQETQQSQLPGPLSGGLVVLAVPPETARTIAGRAPTAFLSVIIHP
jgi:Flp pilus assembly protein CpaB